MMNFFEPLKTEDIEEKVQKNIKEGKTLDQLLDLFEKELVVQERDILRMKNKQVAMWEYYTQHLQKMLASEIQAQNLREQISYTKKKLGGERHVS